jgi:mitochondrial chaperone BCS1
LASEEYYLDNYLNYKRGYLFYGEPGNGKTTTILALAQSCQKHLCILSLSNQELKEEQLLFLISSIPTNCVLVLEDIDTAKVTRSRKDNIGGEKEIGLGTILNILDGPHTPHGLIVFMTTNYKEKLDEAMIRPGRADVSYEFKNTNEFQANELFNRLISNNGHPQRKDLVRRMLNKPMAAAQMELLSLGRFSKIGA